MLWWCDCFFGALWGGDLFADGEVETRKFGAGKDIVNTGLYGSCMGNERRRENIAFPSNLGVS